MLLPILIGSFLVSLIAFSGVLFLVFKPDIVQKLAFYLISFAAGTLLAVVFFDLLPEAIELAEKMSIEPHSVMLFGLVGFLIFFLMERLLIWYHCHDQRVHQVHRSQSTTLILIGDAVHNAIDGVIIALAFIADFKLGILTTISVALHEIPQEVGDFSVLIHNGMSRGRAIFFNVIVAFTTVLSAVTFYYLGDIVNIESFLPAALALVAGGFIYIASVDLIPEIHHDTRPRTMLITTVLFVFGILAIYSAGQLLPH